MEYLVIVVVCLIVFFRSLKYGIVVDDIENRKKHNNPDFYSRRSAIQLLRMNLNGEFPVKNILLDHVITLTIHTLTSLLIYVAFHSLAAALLFAVNVSNNQVSLWLNGKRYGVNTILCLLAYIYPFGIVLWLLTPMFQVNAISFPIVMMMSGNYFVLFLIPLAFFVKGQYLLKWIKSKKETCKVDEYVAIHHYKLILFFKTIAFYFLRGLFPYTPTMYPEKFKRFGMVNSETKDAYRVDAQFLAGIAVVVLIVFGYVVNEELFFGMLWWLIAISVFGNIITLTVPLAERYMYLANVGLMVALAQLLSVINPYAWVFVTVFYATRLWTFMPMYRDINKYLEHHCFYYPENDQAWIFRANKAAEENDIFGVMHLANSGLVANQDSSWLWLHRASGFLKIRELGLTNQCIEMAKKYGVDRYGQIVKAKIDEIESIYINIVKNKREL